MERKKKSKLCIANIDMASVIKLAQDYEDLQHECQELMVHTLELVNHGRHRQTVAFGNSDLSCIAKILSAAFKEGRITPKNLQK